MDAVIKNIIGRRSISSFTDQKVPIELIEELIETSSYAPSSCNTQPWYFLVFNSDDSKYRLNQYIGKGYKKTSDSLEQKHKLVGKIYTKILTFFSNYGKFDKASTYILIFSRPYDTPLFSQAIKVAKNKQIEKIAGDSVRTSSAMAMQNFLLAAHNEGLGTRVKDGIKFLMNFKQLKEDFYKEFKIDNKFELISGIQLGYPTKDSLKRKAPKRISKDKIRKII